MMPFDVGALLYETAKSLVVDAVKKRVNYETEKFFTRRKIENELEKSILRGIEPLLAFLTQEGISVAKQQLLIETCRIELQPLIDDLSLIFKGSLNGQKVVDQLYAGREWPQAIRDENLQGLYSLLVPRIANLICTFPPAIEAWQFEGWKEGFSRLDEITALLRNVTEKIDEVAGQRKSEADALLFAFRHTLLQRVRFNLELGGLRPDRLLASAKMEDFFVLPAFSRKIGVGATLTIRKPIEFYTRLSDVTGESWSLDHRARERQPAQNGYKTNS